MSEYAGQLSLLDQVRADELEKLAQLERESEPGTWSRRQGHNELPSQRHSRTSVASAAAMVPHAPRVRDLVEEFIAQFGPVTDEAIALGLGLNPSTTRPRRVELVRAGRVIAHHETQRTTAGRAATAWIAVQDSF